MSSTHISAKSVSGGPGNPGANGVSTLVSDKGSYVRALHVSVVGDRASTSTSLTIKFFDSPVSTGIVASTAGEIFSINVALDGSSDIQIPHPGILFQFGIVVNAPGKVSLTVFYGS